VRENLIWLSKAQAARIAVAMVHVVAGEELFHPNLPLHLPSDIFHNIWAVNGSQYEFLLGLQNNPFRPQFLPLPPIRAL
jgi:hypothetical protein